MKISQIVFSDFIVAVAASSYSGGDFIIPRNVGSPWAAEGSTPHVPQRCVITRSVLGGPVVQVGLAEPVGHLPVSVRRICVVELVCMYPVPISSYSGIPSRYRVEFWLRSVSSPCIHTVRVREFLGV